MWDGHSGFCHREGGANLRPEAHQKTPNFSFEMRTISRSNSKLFLIAPASPASMRGCQEFRLFTISWAAASPERANSLIFSIKSNTTAIQVETMLALKAPAL